MSAAAGPVKAYDVSLNRPPDETDKYGRFLQGDKETDEGKIPKYGAFRVSKEFRVVNRVTNRPEGVNGIVIQEVFKNTDVTIVECEERGKETRKRYTEANVAEGTAVIDALTHKNVQFMWTRYFEIFIIKDGKSIEDDSFESGSMCTYEKSGRTWVPSTEDAYPPAEFPYTYSFGTINMRGNSVFFPLEALPPTSKKAEIARKDAELLTLLPPMLKNLKVGGVSWSPDTSLPANGLLYLPWSAEVAGQIFSMASSEPFEHNVTATWTLPGQSPKGETTVVISAPPIPDRHIAGGGSRRSVRRLTLRARAQKHNASRARAQKRNTHRKRRQ